MTKRFVIYKYQNEEYTYDTGNDTMTVFEEGDEFVVEDKLRDEVLAFGTRI